MKGGRTEVGDRVLTAREARPPHSEVGSSVPTLTSCLATPLLARAPRPRRLFLSPEVDFAARRVTSSIPSCVVMNPQTSCWNSQKSGRSEERVDAASAVAVSLLLRGQADWARSNSVAHCSGLEWLAMSGSTGAVEPSGGDGDRRELWPLCEARQSWLSRRWCLSFDPLMTAHLGLAMDLLRDW
jgi:hypothetical protein